MAKRRGGRWEEHLHPRDSRGRFTDGDPAPSWVAKVDAQLASRGMPSLSQQRVTAARERIGELHAQRPARGGQPGWADLLGERMSSDLTGGVPRGSIDSMETNGTRGLPPIGQRVKATGDLTGTNPATGYTKKITGTGEVIRHQDVGFHGPSAVVRWSNGVETTHFPDDRNVTPQMDTKTGDSGRYDIANVRQVTYNGRRSRMWEAREAGPTGPRWAFTEWIDDAPPDAGGFPAGTVLRSQITGDISKGTRRTLIERHVATGDQIIRPQTDTTTVATPLGERLTRKRSYSGQSVTVTKEDGTTTSGTLSGWGTSNIRVKDDNGRTHDMSTVGVTVHARTDNPVKTAAGTDYSSMPEDQLRLKLVRPEPGDDRAAIMKELGSRQRALREKVYGSNTSEGRLPTIGSTTTGTRRVSRAEQDALAANREAFAKRTGRRDRHAGAEADAEFYASEAGRAFKRGESPSTSEKAAAAPVRETFRGHGKPASGMYYGRADTPDAEGRHVTVTANGGLVDVVDTKTGKRLESLGVATRLWLAPDTTGAPTAGKSRTTAQLRVDFANEMTQRGILGRADAPRFSDWLKTQPEGRPGKKVAAKDLPAGYEIRNSGKTTYDTRPQYEVYGPDGELIGTLTKTDRVVDSTIGTSSRIASGGRRERGFTFTVPGDRYSGRTVFRTAGDAVNDYHRSNRGKA